MTNFFRAIKAGIAAAHEAAERGECYQAADKTIACSHCGYDHFHTGTSQLPQSGNAMNHTEIFNPTATTLTCARCGRIEWWANSPEKLP